MSATIDVTPIIDAELDRLGYPLPLGASPASLDQRTRELLDEAGISRFTSEQYRRALRRAIAELADNRDSLTKGSPNLARMAEHQRAEQILGKTIYTSDEYLQAFAMAERELAEDEDDAVVYAGDPGGEALDLCAMKLLHDRGEWDPSADQYLQAVTEAAEILGISLTGRTER
jgi:hypothetical protein